MNFRPRFSLRLLLVCVALVAIGAFALTPGARRIEQARVAAELERRGASVVYWKNDPWWGPAARKLGQRDSLASPAGVNLMSVTNAGDEELALVGQLPTVQNIVACRWREDGDVRPQPYRFTPEGLKSLASLPDLRLLELSGTFGMGPGLKHVPLNSIVELDLGMCALQDTDVAFLPRCAHLQVLDLHCNALTSRTIRQLGGLSKLEKLNLSNYELGDIRDSWAAGDDLSAVIDKLDGPIVVDEDLAFLSQLTELRELNLSGTNVRGEFLRHLAPLAKLEMLNLTGTDVDDDTLAQLPMLPSLQMIWLEKTLVRGPGLLHLLDFPKLTMVRMDDELLHNPEAESLSLHRKGPSGDSQTPWMRPGH